MLFFTNDYCEGAHPLILQKLMETNDEKLPGYGTDCYTASATAKIREAIGDSKAEIRFLVGGTQTNQTVIDALLTKYEGVVAASTGHINVHEAGAIEFTGHKVLPLTSHNGKIDAKELGDYLATFFADGNHDHMVFPGMVYISYPTEYGTLYTKSELTAISAVCRAYKLPLYVDGARMGYGLAAKNSDLTLGDFDTLCDAFYIGGTKVGALCGEAVVFPRGKVPPHFVTTVKQHGALLAKGRLTAIQFDVLFTDNLYGKIGKNAIDAAMRLCDAFGEKGYRFFLNSPTNQIFLVFGDEQVEKMKKQVEFDFWEKFDETHTVVRFATSWATTKEDIDRLIKIL